MKMDELMNAQRAFFATGTTLPLAWRKTALKKLGNAISTNEKRVEEALRQDLGKSAAESYMCEIGMTLSELRDILHRMDSFFKPHGVSTPLAQFHARSFTVAEPYGIVLILSPWNYPFMLTMEPLIGALACGNCCVVKPSAYAPHTGAVIKQLLAECFPEEYVAVIEGGRRENQALLEQRFDTIFFTGGQTVGREVLRKAAEHLTPVTLELGGKSPCVVDKTANLELAAKRIAFGKLLNAGQTCVAPDYLLVDRSIQDEFVHRLQYHIRRMVGQNALQNDEYPHIINQKHYDRIMALIDGAEVICGGHGDPAALRIEPTILKNVTPDDPVMQEEIFGPILPILTFDTVDDAAAFIRSREKPLACYLFSQDKSVQKNFLQTVSFGGGCINDTIIHLATSAMGFGGVGASGMGSYHGRKSLETFSHSKSIVKKYTWLDLPIRYAPLGSAKMKLLHLFLR